jgi:hypothetical protein
MTNSDQLLAVFGQCSCKLIELLYGDQPLDETQQMFVETNLSSLRSAFDDSKRRNSQRRHKLGKVLPFTIEEPPS